MKPETATDEETLKLEIQGNYEYAPVELWCSRSKSTPQVGAKVNGVEGSESAGKDQTQDAAGEFDKEQNENACGDQNANNSQAAPAEDADHGESPCQWRVTLRRNRNNNKIYLDRMPNTGHNHTLAEEASKLPKRRTLARRNLGQSPAFPPSSEDSIQECQRLVAELCRGFYQLGWVSGTGGSISIKVGEDRICMAPSGVQKERMQPEDIYVLNAEGDVVQTPVAKLPPHKPPKLSECQPLFMVAYRRRQAGAVIHSHSIHAAMATMLDPSAKEFRITQLEMIKGIKGYGYYDTLVVPIIENTARECELTESLEKAIIDYPNTQAVLVRRHGIYVWGDNWIQAKTQAECYHYLFEAACKMNAAGIPYDATPGLETATQYDKKRQKSSPCPKAVVLDIEGTTTPLSFTKDTLFPFARSNVRQYLRENFQTADVISVIGRLSELLAQDKCSRSEEIIQSLIIPDYKKDMSSEEIETTISQVVAYVEFLMDGDRKVEPLKTLQGYVWEKGYQSGQIKGDLFGDVPLALKRWVQKGIRVYIYSSGSRQAQRLLFEHTAFGDMTPSISGYFDTTIGDKQSRESYLSIKSTVGLQKPEDIVFLTDRLGEAKAAFAGGFTALIVNRPGNEEIFEEHTFEIVENFDSLY